tara:strand:+ start:97 stop:1956 length:1860 start_codon:yes stop_codon:yes gene_type:complete
MPAAEGMNIKTNTEMVEKARKGVMEFLLANHPLDCPVCDQGGECDLQDQSLYYGVDKSRFSENKRYVSEKYMGPLIKTQMTRCIHCTRCVRFATEVAGVPEIGAIGRGENMEITTYLEKSMESELSGNVIDLCPVGALTSKPYAFSARPWELKKTESIDVLDAVGSNIRVDTYGWEVKRILPRLNEDINEEWISDKTRYSCDGLLKQRLDTPYVKKDKKLVKSSWDEAIEIIIKKFNETENSKIAGHLGDLISLETTLAFKKFFELLESNNLEFREKKFYINQEDKMNYLFNSTINGIEKSDLILLIGCNPRHEATILNARIRKAFTKNKTQIFSIGDPGDQTYNYKVIGDNTQTIKDIIEEKHEFNKVFNDANKPLIIIGESVLELDSGGYIFEELKNFLYRKKLISEKWNSLNILIQNASTVGALDLKILNTGQNNFDFFDNLNNNKFKILYLLNSDNLKFEKNDEFIIYQGSHGDRGAEIADVILPSAAYTEEDGLFQNLEGRVQECRKASYPVGEALESWKVLNKLTQAFKNKNLFDSFNTLRDETLKKLVNFDSINKLPKYKEPSKKINNSFKSEKIFINPIDYYFSNSISRASKVMSECRDIKLKHLKSGTNN